MSITIRQTIDTRGLNTTGLTSSTTLVGHLQNIQAAVFASRTVGNQPRVEKLLDMMNDVADLMRELHL